MSKIRLAGRALALFVPLCAPLWAHAQTPSVADIAALQQEIQALRASHEARLQALEQRLKAALDAAAAPAKPLVAAAAPPPAVPTPSPTAAANVFNPAMSLILSGGYVRSSQDPASYRIRGVALPADAEVGPGSRGFSLAESELGLSASIDPWWRGAANIALHPDNAVSVEEAYVQTTALGQGLTVKAGRFLSSVGYLNSQHAHTWDFADNPLAYQALLGTQYGDDGVQLQWLAPTDLYLALNAELGRGRGFPGSDSGRNGAGMRALALHAGGDWGDSHSWRAGVSVLNTQATDLAWVAGGGASAELPQRFSGRSRVWVADAVWKWAPNGNATRTSFKLQGELLRSTHDGSVVDDAGAAGAYRAAQSGWYLQGIYQFMPSWRVGLRTERLNLGSVVDGSSGSAANLTAGLRQPSKHTLMLDYSPSEFSRLRLQVAQDRARADAPGTGADRQITLQYQMSLGAHGAHSY
jgi:hypothetical protein